MKIIEVTNGIPASLTNASKFLAEFASAKQNEANMVSANNLSPLLYNRTILLPKNFYETGTTSTPAIKALYYGGNPKPNGWTHVYTFGSSVNSYNSTIQSLEVNSNDKFYVQINYMPFNEWKATHSQYTKIIPYITTWGKYPYGTSYMVNNESLPLTEDNDIDNRILIDTNEGIVIESIRFYRNRELLTDYIPSYAGLANSLFGNLSNEHYWLNDFYLVIPISTIPVSNMDNAYRLSPLDTFSFYFHDLDSLFVAEKIEVSYPFSYLRAFDNAMRFTPLNNYDVVETNYQYSDGMLMRLRGRVQITNGRETKCLYADNIDIVKDYFKDWGFTAVDSYGDIPPQPEQRPSDSDIPNFPDDSTDIIELLPSNISLTDFVDSNIFTPLNTREILSWLCTNDFIDNVNRLYNDPISAVLSVKLYNLDFVEHDNSYVNPREAISIVNVSHNVPCYAFRLGYNYIIYGGSVNYISYYGDYNDFINSQYSIYIPYIGTLDLDPNDVVNNKLSLYFVVDTVGGDDLYILKSDEDIIKSGRCSMGMTIPLFSSSYNSTKLNGIMSVIEGVLTLSPSKLLQPFYTSEVQYQQRTSISNNSNIQFIPPYLIITKYPPNIPNKLYSLNGMVAQNSGILADYNTSSADNYIEGEIIKITSAATDFEKKLIADLIRSGIYL